MWRRKVVVNGLYRGPCSTPAYPQVGLIPMFTLQSAIRTRLLLGLSGQDDKVTSDISRSPMERRGVVGARCGAHGMYSGSLMMLKVCCP